MKDCAFCGRSIANFSVHVVKTNHDFHGLETPDGEPAPKGVQSCWELSQNGTIVKFQPGDIAFFLAEISDA
jgi:hypothetical protein